MIDIHNHILLDADVRPKSLEDKIPIIRQDKEQSIKANVATSQKLHPRYSNNIESDTKSSEELNKLDEIAKLNIQFNPGEEIRLPDQILHNIEQHKIYGMNYTKYL